MTLQQAVFFAGIAAYAATLVTTLALLVGATVNFFGWAKTDLTMAAWLIGVWLLIRVICAVWLKRLGGIPAEFRAK